MGKKLLYLCLIVILFGIFGALLYSQETDQAPGLRTLRVEWYIYTKEGVKIKYITFNGTPKLLYLPRSFEKKFYRFVAAPKETGNQVGLPALIVHMRGQEVTFIDIYTLYQRKKRVVSEISEEDRQSFQEAEQKGKPDLEFQ